VDAAALIINNESCWVRNRGAKNFMPLPVKLSDIVDELQMTDDSAFRDNVLAEIAIEFLEENKIPYTRDRG
jgi:hypothetical protein